MFLPMPPPAAVAVVAEDGVSCMLSAPVEPMLWMLRTLAGFESVPPEVPAMVMTGFCSVCGCDGAVLGAELCRPPANGAAALPIVIGGGAAGPPIFGATATDV